MSDPKIQSKLTAADVRNLSGAELHEKIQKTDPDSAAAFIKSLPVGLALLLLAKVDPARRSRELEDLEKKLDNARKALEFLGDAAIDAKKGVDGEETFTGWNKTLPGEQKTLKDLVNYIYNGTLRPGDPGYQTIDFVDPKTQIADPKVAVEIIGQASKKVQNKVNKYSAQVSELMQKQNTMMELLSGVLKTNTTAIQAATRNM